MDDNKRIGHLISMSLVQNGEKDDDCLHRPGFDINTRLFEKNKEFNKLIHRIIDYMKMTLCIDFKDYNKLKGISGANIGIPFNIVAVLHNGIIEVFINPSIRKASRSKTTVLSNCGSINLPKAIHVGRHAWIQVKWMDTEGRDHKRYFTVSSDDRIAGTLQHEIDHNQGVLIIDLKK